MTIARPEEKVDNISIKKYHNVDCFQLVLAVSGSCFNPSYETKCKFLVSLISLMKDINNKNSSRQFSSLKNLLKVENISKVSMSLIDIIKN